MRPTVLSLVFALISCTATAPASVPVPVDASQCDLTSCAAGMSLVCCELAPLPPKQVKVVGSLGGVIKLGWAPDFGGFAGTSRGCMQSTGPGRFALEMPLNEGDRMLSLTVALIGNFAADVDINSLSVAPNGALTLGTVGTLTVTNVPNSWFDYPINLVDTFVSGGVSHWFEFGVDQAGACVGAVRLTYDHP